MSKVKELQISLMESMKGESVEDLPPEWTEDWYWLDSYDIEENWWNTSEELPF